MAQGLLFEGSVLAYDPTTNGAQWIPMQGSASNLSLVEEDPAQELSNIVLHDPSEVPQRMDHFGEQKGESGTQKAMEMGYQPSSEGDAGSNSSDGPIPLSALCNALQDTAARAALAGWTSTPPIARISMCQGVLGMPPAKLQTRMKGSTAQLASP